MASAVSPMLRPGVRRIASRRSCDGWAWTAATACWSSFPTGTSSSSSTWRRFAPAPSSTGTGLDLGVAAPILPGGAIHLQDVWQPSVSLARIREHQCTHAPTATPFVRMALDAFDPAQDDVSSMRVWVCAGPPIPASLADEVATVFRGCRLLPLYGASEIFATTVCWASDPPEMAVISDGRPALDGVEVKIVNESGEELP